MIDVFLLHKDGTLKRTQDVEEAVRLVEAAGEDWKLWLDLEDPPEEEFGLLKALFDFHFLSLEDCKRPAHNPKVDDYGDYLFLIMHAARWNAEANGLQTVELDCFLSSKFLVTHHLEPLPSIQEGKVRCLKKEGALNRGTDYLLHIILKNLVDNYSPALEQINGIMGSVEQEILSNPTPSTLKKLFSLKKEVDRLWRLAFHQKEILSQLSRRELPIVRQEQTHFYKNIYDHFVRVCDIAESHREFINGALNSYPSFMSSRTNTTLKALTIFALIMLPLSVIAVIFGMNLEVLPELQWRYGHYSIFGGMAVFAVGMLILFRWKRWL